MFENIAKISNTISGNLKQVADDAISYATADMADMNVEQMLSGIAANGRPITPEYRSDAYAQFKRATGGKAPFGTPDLHLTGDFHEGLFARYDGNSIVFGSTDSKAGDLADKYGNDIFGLTDENKEDIKDGVIFPEVLKWISEQLNML